MALGGYICSVHIVTDLNFHTNFSNSSSFWWKLCSLFTWHVSIHKKVKNLTYSGERKSWGYLRVVIKFSFSPKLLLLFQHKWTILLFFFKTFTIYCMYKEDLILICCKVSVYFTLVITNSLETRHCRISPIKKINFGTAKKSDHV